MEEEQKSLREIALAYEAPARTGNISDLPQVSADLKVTSETFTKKDGDEFTIQTVTVDGAKYRVPTSVINQVKVLLEDNPKLQNIKVKKTGQGMDTEYVVIPLQ